QALGLRATGFAHGGLGQEGHLSRLLVVHVAIPSSRAGPSRRLSTILSRTLPGYRTDGYGSVARAHPFSWRRLCIQMAAGGLSPRPPVSAPDTRSSRNSVHPNTGETGRLPKFWTARLPDR